MEVQTKLAEVDRELGERLLMFQSADKVAHKPTTPTLSVQNETFILVLSTSMVYLPAHPNYKFRACQNMAPEMVNSHMMVHQELF